MAGASLLTLLDDIATILDDVALMSKMAARKSVAMADDVSVMTKVAAQKTASVLGDDLALNAEQVSGVHAHRELPVVWAVARGSLVNKVILVPTALLISAFAPWAITPLLMLGGTYLCLEGVEKLAHHDEPPADRAEAALARVGGKAASAADIARLEKTKVRGAIRTDFILSAEIIVITLGTVAQADFMQQVMVLSAIAVLMTVGVYGLVAGIVKMDDVGLWLTRRPGRVACRIGQALVAAAPKLMKGLAVAGTAAMFLVGGGIIVHGVPPLAHAIESAGAKLAGWPLGGVWEFLATHLLGALVGAAVGAVALGAWTLVQRLRGKA
ncbi:DUF808 domain-containing protein [Pulveribacter sp.]|uniref:DUF808 domain-containing protein n=1 Tax=Pulveribacter sp. TaxID=2678893 RepID=UPI002897B2FD|nr:DUF808 domain-containing protein [Pulveribacter sp.]